MTVEGDEKAVRSRVFMDISIGGLPSGRLVFELFNDIAPKTAENFRALCAGDMGVGKNTGKPLTYKGMVFHRVVKDFMIQGGDFTNANGTGGESIYGGTFEDETFELKHDRPYLLSMANRGKDTNGSQFFITTQPAPHLDNVHVVFGTVIGGAALVRQLEALAVDRNARPLQDVAVTNCGQLVRVSAKKRKQEKEEKEESDADADSDHSQKKDKKKKKDKKEKKKKSKRHSSESGDEEETPEAPAHPLVSTSKIDPREIPDVPTNRFLMRGGRDQDDRSDPRRDRERMRYREREHRSYTRSGRIIKGRGVFRYRTPSRSRSRSRSVTPPHWRQAQRRIIKLSEFERAEQERSEKEQHDVTKRKEIEKIHSLVPFLGDAEGTTPDNHPEEKEEGECDSTLDRSQTDRVDYNALDFEEDIEHDDNDTSHKRKPVEKVDRRREMRRTPENRAEMLALALGVNPKHDQQSDAGSFSRDSRDSRESTRRREGLASTVGYASKLSSAVGNVSEGLAKGHHEEKSKDGYDPFSLLRSTFNRGGEKKDQNQQRKEGDRREAIKARLGEKEKDREDKRDRKTDRDEKDRKQSEQKNDKEDRNRRHDNKEERTRKLPEIPEKEDRARKNSEKEDRERKISERDDRRRHSEKNEKEDRTRKHSERDERDRKHSEQRDHRRTDRHRSERSERREKSKERVRSEKSRDNDRSKARDDDKDKKRRRSRTPSPAKERSKSRDRRPSAAETREKSGERTPLDEEKKKVGQEDERNEARKELMEIVRLIKSRQRDRENKAAAVLAKKKRESSHSDSSDSDGDKRRRRSSDRDRRRRSNSRGRHSSSERRTRRRRSRSPRRDRRDRRRSSSSR
ncbi:unnamed protein product [Spodoptera littoralis]|uniref:peptidylprolyl isomerase n=1 Tax=Spodoptera littoralis TaxID=7109 RepID=A0A9P0HXU9_SPOLI|nr:unnamed protein product [Spodoptera littoralis]CAH1635474.1 unnamed protein product [Spodoptera littoralis]